MHWNSNMEKHIYKNLEFSKWNPPATSEQIAETERMLGAELPRDYREFLLKINGGLISTNPSFTANDHSNTPEEWILKRLMGVEPCESASISSQLGAFDFNERVPNLIIPIGILKADYRMCLSLRKIDYGYIYMWGPNHLLSGDEEEPIEQTMKDLFLVAKSFSEFLGVLKIHQ